MSSNCPRGTFSLFDSSLYYCLRTTYSVIAHFQGFCEAKSIIFLNVCNNSDLISFSAAFGACFTVREWAFSISGPHCWVRKEKASAGINQLLLKSIKGAWICFQNKCTGLLIQVYFLMINNKHCLVYNSLSKTYFLLKALDIQPRFK